MQRLTSNPAVMKLGLLLDQNMKLTLIGGTIRKRAREVSGVEKRRKGACIDPIY